jgi:hypothetical protein
MDSIFLTPEAALNRSGFGILLETRSESQETRRLKTRFVVLFNGSPLQHSALDVQRSTLNKYQVASIKIE